VGRIFIFREDVAENFFFSSRRKKKQTTTKRFSLSADDRNMIRSYFIF
jgi:hypothetical protein